jgi:hypothetical protein
MPVVVFAGDAAVEVDEASALSDDIYSFSLQIGDALYQLPMSYEELLAQGWEVDDYSDDSESLSPDTYAIIYMNRGEDSIAVDLVNFDINAHPVSECTVGGIKVDGSYDFDYEATAVILPAGITMGKSTEDEIRAAYGEPSSVYEGDLYTELTYRQGSYEEVELYVYKDDNVLKKLDMQYLHEPEDFTVGEVSTEVPELIETYTAPEALGSTCLDPVVEYFGDLYQLPVPVSELVENGWKILDSSEGDYVSGGGVAFVDMMKDNQSVHVTIYNDTENAVTYENCRIHELSFHTYDSENIAMKLSGEITLGADIDEICKAAEAEGYLCQDDREDGYVTIYKDEDHKNEEYVEFWLSSDGDGVSIDGMTGHFEGTEENEE